MGKVTGMNGLHLAHVTRTNSKTSYPRFVFSAEWMHDMGFVSGALVQYLPEDGGLSFVLCNENIAKYSELVDSTKEKGGSLLQVAHYRDGLQLWVSGSVLNKHGLNYGDALIARYEYGFIRLRKLPGGSVKLVSSHIVGPWLVESGFLPNAVFAISAVPGLIACTLIENDLRRIRDRAAEMVKHARLNKLQLLQVQASNYHTKVGRQPGILTFFDIPRVCLDKAGFSPNEMLLAFYEPGLVKIRQPDFIALGF